MKSIFNFDQIDPTIEEQKLEEIKPLYKFYHKRFWCYKRVYKHLKRSYFLTNLALTTLVAAGTIAGGVTLNPVVLGVISGAGLLKTSSEFKNYRNKIEMSKFAYTTYEKALSGLRCFLRGEDFKSLEFVHEMKTKDEITIDLCLNFEKYSEGYEKEFCEKKGMSEIEKAYEEELESD